MVTGKNIDFFNKARELLSKEHLSVFTDDLREVQDIIEEFDRYQIELELKNEELKQTRKELQILKQRYYHLFNTSPTGYFILNKNFIIEESNQTVTQLLQHSPANFLKKNFLDFIHPDFKKKFTFYAQQVLEVKQSHSCELKLKRGGKFFYAIIQSKIIHYKGSAYFQLAIIDIDSRKKAEIKIQELNKQLEEKVNERTIALKQQSDNQEKIRQQLSQKEKLTTKILDLSSEGIRLIDKNFTIVKVNQYYAKMNNTTKEAIEGKKCYEFMCTQNCKTEYCTLNQLKNKRNYTIDKEIQMNNKAGQKRWYLHHIKLLLDEDKNIEGFLQSFRDITEIKQASLKIEEKEKKLNSIFNNSADAIMIHSLDGKFIEINELACKRLGYTRKEMFQLSLQDIDSHKFAPLIPKRIKMLKRLGRNVFETEHVTKSGQVIPAEVNAKIVDYNDEKVILCIIRDITNRKKAEKALKASESKFRLLAQNIADVVWVFKPNIKKYTYVSPAIKQLLGYAENELKKLNLRQLMNKETLFRVAELYKKRMKSFLEKPFNTHQFCDEYELIRKDKTKIWTEVTTNFIINVDKELEIVGVVRDISARKKDEMELKKRTQEIEMAYEMLTKNHKTIENQKNELQELNATKDKFFSIIAHDLKNPFNQLLGFSRLLVENHRSYDAEKRDIFLQYIFDAGQQAFDLLNNLLEWSRSQTGRINYNPEVINLFNLSKKWQSIHTPLANQKPVQLYFDILSDINVKADKNMLNTIMRNLISNAIKFTPRNGKILVKAIQKNDLLAYISVADTGVGIASEDIPKLFRIDVSHSTKGTNDEGGTGLGLILCKEFIEKNNGKITVESQENKGSTFSFTLPLV